MKKQLVALSLLGLLGPVCSHAAPIVNPDDLTGVISFQTVNAAPVWSANADGFASVATPDQNGTTGGAGGRVVTVDNLADLEKYALAPEPLVILIKGTIAKDPFGKSVKIASNKTLLGLGKDATILHGEISLSGVSNVIIRNLTLRDSRVPPIPDSKGPDFDGIQVDNSHHIWIDHCTITRMADGLIDVRGRSDYLTISWCDLSDQDKAFGIGWTKESDKLHITIHHTRIRETIQRNPSFDNGTGHLYNNWLQNIAAYGNYSRGKSRLVIENSVFEKVNNPLQRGPEAELVARGNVFNGCTSDQDPKTLLKGKAFDPKTFYAYTLDEAVRVPDLLQQYTGAQVSIGNPEMAALMAAPR